MTLFNFDHDKFYTAIPQTFKNTFSFFYTEWKTNKSNPVLLSNLEISAVNIMTLATVNPKIFFNCVKKRKCF